MQRKLSGVFGPGTSCSFTVARKIVEGRDTLVFKHPAGGVAFMVSPDELFDAAGNRFVNNLPTT